MKKQQAFADYAQKHYLCIEPIAFMGVLGLSALLALFGMRNKLYLIAWLCFCLCSHLYGQKKEKKELFIPMDYSTCGYRASEAQIPDVKVAVFVNWQPGDCADLLQEAIDYAGSLKADAEGHRGTVLIGEGDFHLEKALRVKS